MSIVEYVMPFNQECNSCHGKGYWFFSGYNAEELSKLQVILDCTVNGNKGICNACKGSGKLDLESLEVFK